ncbi:GDP-mannose dehydrogenase [Candidatus Woesearchaeota archaeon CG11_big_fil_rev_8_21_14_0_20_43_8]|nr:MAG: GDP-mannose dehydrogenase [Candidatus Woesearchaeota archaeon CG11_big_fil_rev_8_21_14_0_20_43_8]PIO05216.1 MAG: nucleotide sugar dehydrogenase [Candidatus Woesearchaeota archaeon CG08_land_8_20_14_0_20_43_7]
MKIAVIGLGKAGLPLAAVIAEAGIEVIGVDTDDKKVKLINSGGNPVPEEPGLSEILKKQGGKGIVATSDYGFALKKCTMFIVIVPLFIDDNKKCDFSILDKAFSALAKGLKKGDLVVLETTVPPKTTEKHIRNLLEKNGMKAGEDFYLAYSPERIMTGYSISRYREFPKVVGGIDPESGKRAAEAYGQFCSDVKVVSDCRTAELVKVAEGVYRDVNIALANELSKVCEEYGVDFWEMRKHANHQFCHIHEPGSVGGHCIPVYPWFLINNTDVPLIKFARDLNDDMIEHYISKLPAGIKKVGVVGFSYRAGVKETAYTRSIPLLRSLEKKGFDAYVYDPMYSTEEISGLGFKKLEDFSDVDAVIVMNKEEKARDDLLEFDGLVIDVKGLIRDAEKKGYSERKKR